VKLQPEHRDAVYTVDASSDTLEVGHVLLKQPQNHLSTSLPQPEGLQISVTTVTSSRTHLPLATNSYFISDLLTAYIFWPLGGIFLVLGEQGTYIGPYCGL
jgi:hypothetical protein